MYDYDQIKELIGLIAESGLGEFEVERNGFRLRIAGRQVAPATVIAAPATVAGPAAGASVQPPPVEPASTESETAVDEDSWSAEDEDLHHLTSPIVGTFYIAPSADAEPFVEAGDRVSRGQVLCIVEAMKLMNEIEADDSGTVIAILVDDAQPVQFGQALFRIRPD